MNEKQDKLEPQTRKSKHSMKQTNQVRETKGRRKPDKKQ
jgi:hypothetical protein